MLTINSLSISFQRYQTSYGRTTIPVLADVSLTVAPGEIVALIGASGAGKSLIAHGLLGLLPANATLEGEILFKGQTVSADSIGSLRGRHIALIPQATSHLNPLMRVGSQVVRSARLSGSDPAAARVHRDQLFARYRLHDTVKSLFPFQLSGGMARRVLTATATATSADLIIADEPTTGLDRHTAGKSLAHLRELADEGKGVLLITHDLGYGLKVADTICVLYRGTTMEISPAADLADGREGMHPYTRTLWQAMPENGFLCPLPATTPGKRVAPGSGCPFASRCSEAGSPCRTTLPPLKNRGGRTVRCHHAHG